MTVARATPRQPASARTALTLLPILAAAACGNPPPSSESTDARTPPAVAAAGASPAVGAVRLTADQARALAIRTTTVARTSVSFEVRAPGAVAPAPDRYAEVSAPVSGRIASMAVHEGERVERGQVVAQLESLELAELVSTHREREAERRFAELQVRRYEPLVERRISPAAALETARAELARADARSDAALIRLRSLGIDDRDLDRWNASAVDRPLLDLRSPIDGVVGEHLIELGQAVTAYRKMMSVVDTERVLARAFLTPDDAAQVRVGDAVRVVATAMSGREFEGSIAAVVPMVGEGTRSVTAIVPLRANGALVPGQSVRVAIRAESARPVLAVPLSAVEFQGDHAVVFVRGADPLTWIPTPVEVARLGAERVVVESGIEVGDVVATTQVFALKALARFAEYGEEP